MGHNKCLLTTPCKGETEIQLNKVIIGMRSEWHDDVEKTNKQGMSVDVQ
jgi:hypothetical protein